MKLRNLAFVFLTAAGCVTDADSNLDSDLTNSAPSETGQATFGPVALTTATCTTLPKAAGGRAYGIATTSKLPNVPPIAAQPDTNVANPNELVGVPGLVGNPTNVETVFGVSNQKTITSVQSSDTAIATVNELESDTLTVFAGDLSFSVRIHAEQITAQARSTATKSGSSHSKDGSLVEGLVINGTHYGSYTTTETIALPNNVGYIKVLEQIGSAKGIAVNGIRVHVNDIAATPVDETTDVVVAHAESSATFPCVR